MRTLFLTTLTCTALGIGCTASGGVGYSAQATTPELVYIDPEVQVIADYDEPVFYLDSYYWRYDAGVWYRSPRHTSGWVRVDVVPPAIRRIDRPTMYVRYHGDARARKEERKDERRELKEERKEERRDEKDARQDQKQEQKEERKEAKEQQKEQRQEQKEQQKEQRQEQKQEQKDARKDAKQDSKAEKKDDKENKGDKKDHKPH